MNLVAMMIVRNEMDRYLRPVIETLQGFCDEIRVSDDQSTDGTADWLEAQDRVSVRRVDDAGFFRHEGQARQSALVWAHKAQPTHVLAVDADELVENGQALREALETPKMMVWTLDMQEIWMADDHYLYSREDGGWRDHPVPVCYACIRVVGNRRDWQIRPVALACGRVPPAVARNGRKMPSGARILHLGWACEADRQARYDRYVEHDSGKFHRSAHLDSIMWPPNLVRTQQRNWPADLPEERRAELLARIMRGQVPDG